jgi:hypothetical protein
MINDYLLNSGFLFYRAGILFLTGLSAIFDKLLKAPENPIPFGQVPLSNPEPGAVQIA